MTSKGHSRPHHHSIHAHHGHWASPRSPMAAAWPPIAQRGGHVARASPSTTLPATATTGATATTTTKTTMRGPDVALLCCHQCQSPSLSCRLVPTPRLSSGLLPGQPCTVPSTASAKDTIAVALYSSRRPGQHGAKGQARGEEQPRHSCGDQHGEARRLRRGRE